MIFLKNHTLASRLVRQDNRYYQGYDAFLIQVRFGERNNQTLTHNDKEEKLQYIR